MLANVATTSTTSPNLTPPAQRSPSDCAVFFDAVHTLFDMSPSYTEAFVHAARDLGHPVELDEIERALGPLFQELEKKSRQQSGHECSDAQLRAYWLDFNERVYKGAGLDGAAKSLAHEVERRLDSGQYAHVFDGAKDTLRAIRAMGVRIGIISNGTGGMHDTLTALGLADEVELVLVSATVGWEKPATEIFRHAESRVGVPPQRCLFFGDSYWADVVGATRAGWEAVWFNPRGKWAPAPCREMRSLSEAPRLAEAWLQTRLTL